MTAQPHDMLVGSLSTEQRATIETPAPVEVVSFSGGDSFALVASIAKDLEREGRGPDVQWTRDRNGIIDGIAILAVPR